MWKRIDCKLGEYLKVYLRDPKMVITLRECDPIYTGWFWTSFKDNRNRDWTISTYNIMAIVKKKV